MRLLFAFLFFLSTLLNAQEKNSSKYIIIGKIISQKTLEAIPYAHVILNNTSIGTITNEFGAFRLVLDNKNANSTLKISSIGYESAYMPISSGKKGNKLVIRLKESTKFLESVVITPKDEARQLVEETILKIRDNYPLEPRSSEGFFRSVAKLNNEIYFTTEANLQVNKKSYSSKKSNGTVKLSKGRYFRNDSLISKFQTLLMAGPHIPHRFDFVMNRAGPLSNTKKYNFSILDTIDYEGDELVKIHFSAIKRDVTGDLYISLEDKSFVKGQYFYKPPNFEKDLLENLKKTKRINLNYEANYKKGKKGWELFLVKYNTSFAYNGDTLSVKDIYTTTHKYDRYQKITYDSTLQYSDIFLNNTGVYDSTFWKNYNIILPDKETEQLFKKYEHTKVRESFENQERKLSKREILLEQIGKFKFTLGVFAQIASIDNLSINYTNGTSIITETIPNANFLYFGLSTVLEYYFSPSFFMGLDTKGSFAGNNYSSISFKTGYNKEITAFSRPVSVNFSLNIGNYRYGYVVGKYNVANNLEINSKTFDSGEVEVSLESRRWAVEPTFRLSLEMSHQLSLFAEVGWNVPFHTTDGLYFKEKGQPFWKTKQTFLKLPNSNVNLSDGNSEISTIPLKTNLMINIGILYQFKH